MDKRSHWEFFDTGRRTWKWKVTQADGTESESAEEFATLLECTAHAAQHGYVVWKSEDERRRNLKLSVIDALKRGQ
jgi:hypothetical protein